MRIILGALLISICAFAQLPKPGGSSGSGGGGSPASPLLTFSVCAPAGCPNAGGTFPSSDDSNWYKWTMAAGTFTKCQATARVAPTLQTATVVVTQLHAGVTTTVCTINIPTTYTPGTVLTGTITASYVAGDAFLGVMTVGDGVGGALQMVALQVQ